MIHKLLLGTVAGFALVSAAPIATLISYTANPTITSGFLDVWIEWQEY